MLTRMIERETADIFDLTDGVTIEVGTASFKTVRGYTIVACVGDYRRRTCQHSIPRRHRRFPESSNRDE